MAYALFDGHSLKSITLRDTEAWQRFFGLGTEGAVSDVLTIHRKVPWIYRGVSLRANAVSAMPYTFSDGKNDYDPGVILGTSRLPIRLDLPGFLRQVEMWLTLYGRAYAFKEINGLRRATSLVPYLPTGIEPKFGPGGLQGFERQYGAGTQKILPDELFHVWYPAAGEEQGPGESPADVALTAANVLYSKDRMIRALFARGALKPTIVSLPERTSPTDRDRLESKLARMATGLRNAFKPLAWLGELKAQELGPDPDKLAMRETTDMSREDIAAALGVPPSMLAANAANFATSQQDVRTFHDWTVIPEAMLICDALNDQVFEAYGLRLRERHDLMEMYQDDKSDEANKLLALVKGGALTINELRHMMDLGDLSQTEQIDLLRFLAALAVAQAPSLPAGGDQGLQAGASGQAPAIIDATLMGKSASVEEDLAKWQTKALRRWNEGKPEKALDFVSEAIPGTLAAAIRGGLEAARSEADVKAAFVWGRYP